MMINKRILKYIAILVSFIPFYAPQAAVVSDVASSKHNLSSSGGPNVKAASEDKICVFCHTPHGADASAPGPLWNRQLSTTPDANYTLYSSDSTDSLTIGAPGGSSKLCLSCHDGAMTLGKVNVLNGATDVTIDMGATTTMPVGTDGYTRNLGIDLSNDHPISFDYSIALTTADTELYKLADVTHIAERDPGVSPVVPLEDGKVQCTSCHDPHLNDTTKNIKFLRLNRFQETSAPTDGSFDTTTYKDIVCLACHNKEGWGSSAHAQPLAADEKYESTAAALRDFPADIQVWEAACLNCHDTHTVQGARRLLREGVDGSGNPALEETCYQCHDAQANTILQATPNEVPDIKSDFDLTYHMPIITADQAATSEVHSIGTGTVGNEGSQRGQNFVESQVLLGKTDVTNRHAECTDCHNPHRVKKNRLFNDATGTPDTAGTHDHNAAVHTNIASGVLSGITGVEPTYGSTTWGNTDAQISYNLKKGPAGASTAVTSGYVTREYQVCLKCHSNYAWPNGAPPTNGPSIGANGLAEYTNQAMEFHPADPGEPGTNINHSSWHPVIKPTERYASVRGLDAAAVNQPFLAPWNDAAGADANIGVQTMYCSDCHGSSVASLTSVEPDTGKPWGPHGSSNPFILKGPWTQTTGTASTNGLCFKCHDYSSYASTGPTAAGNAKLSGFSGIAGAGCQINHTTTNLHLGHAEQIGNMQCTWCHVAVPHGWQNKALLVDISSDIDPTDGVTVIGDNCATANTEPCTVAPYYLNSQLGGGGAVQWQNSGGWQSGNCGGVNWMMGGGGPFGGGGGCPQ